jgi:hypothetical protein
MAPCGIFILRVHFQMVPFRFESTKVGMVDLNAHESTAGQRSKSSYIFFMRIGSSYIRSSCMHTCIQKKKRCRIMTLELGVLEFVSVPSWYDVRRLTTWRYDPSMTGATGHSSAPVTIHRAVQAWSFLGLSARSPGHRPTNPAGHSLQALNDGSDFLQFRGTQVVLLCAAPLYLYRPWGFLSPPPPPAPGAVLAIHRTNLLSLLF